MKQLDDEVNSLEDDVYNHLTEGDFVFIIDDQGLLKTVLVPEEFDVDSGILPANLKKIFKIFGIKQLTNQTLH